MNLCSSLLKDLYEVFGIDNLNDYYDLIFKQDRLNQLTTYKNFSFSRSDISNPDPLEKVFLSFQPDKVFNLAGQAGVR